VVVVTMFSISELAFASCNTSVSIGIPGLGIATTPLQLSERSVRESEYLEDLDGFLSRRRGQSGIDELGG